MKKNTPNDGDRFYHSDYGISRCSKKCHEEKVLWSLVLTPHSDDEDDTGLEDRVNVTLLTEKQRKKSLDAVEFWPYDFRVEVKDLLSAMDECKMKGAEFFLNFNVEREQRYFTFSLVAERRRTAEETRAVHAAEDAQRQKNNAHHRQMRNIAFNRKSRSATQRSNV